MSLLRLTSCTVCSSIIMVLPPVQSMVSCDDNYCTTIFRCAKRKTAPRRRIVIRVICADYNDYKDFRFSICDFRLAFERPSSPERESKIVNLKSKIVNLKSKIVYVW